MGVEEGDEEASDELVDAEDDAEFTDWESIMLLVFDGRTAK